MIKINNFLRRCKRCNNFFRTDYKYSKICNKCNKKKDYLKTLKKGRVTNAKSNFEQRQRLFGLLKKKRG